MRITQFDFILYLVASFTVGFILGTSTPARAESAISQSTEGRLQARKEYCRHVGQAFAVTASKDPLVVDSDYSAAAMLFVIGNPGVQPYDAYWYGYGFCMARESVKDDQA